MGEPLFDSDAPIILTSSGERLKVTAVSSNTLTFPWGLSGPALLTSRRLHKRPRAWLGVRAWRIPIPWRLARRWDRRHSWAGP